MRASRSQSRSHASRSRIAPARPAPLRARSLDAESIDALAVGIREFQGGVVLVSHDARLIRDAGCRLWVCDKQDVAPYAGDLDDYKASLLRAIHDDEEKLDAVMERQRAAAEELRLAAVKERARKLRETREAKAAAAAVAAAALRAPASAPAAEAAAAAAAPA